MPYYRLDFAGVFALRRTWELFDKANGCQPLNNPQAAILMEKKPPLLPGEKALQAKQAVEQRQTDAEKAKSRNAEQKAESQQLRPRTAKIDAVALKTGNDQVNSKPSEVGHKTPPPFDMLDLPDAMDKIGFTVAAKLARRWFNGRQHEVPNDRHYVYPADMIDTTSVSLDFVLQYPDARDRYDNLINNAIYEDASIDAIKQAMRRLLAKKFLDNDLAYASEIDALAHVRRDVQKLHSEFQFQREVVSNFDTLDWRYSLTDLTASLANFSFIAAIANAQVCTEKYYSYPKGKPMVYCCQSTVEVTHIYVYAKDSYSFTDRPGRKASQYLGHWNRTGVVLVADAVASDLAIRHDYDIQWGNLPYREGGFDRPVDVLKGMFGEMRKQDVYYPVRNSDYLRWRRKFNRGGDFAIYTEPKKIKLRKPIKLMLEEICKPSN
jgi:hypothetical protein